MIFLKLFETFFKIGLFTFGGGMAMIPLIKQEIINHGWMTMDQIVDFIAISESTPGPLAVNMSTYVGFSTGGILGAIISTLGIILPSFLIILLVAFFYKKVKDSKYVKGAMLGIRPTVVGLIAAAIISVGENVFDFKKILSFNNIASLIIFIVALILVLKKVHPGIIMVVSGILGILLVTIQPIIY